MNPNGRPPALVRATLGLEGCDGAGWAGADT